MTGLSKRGALVLSLIPWILTGFGAGLLNGLLGAAGGILLVTLLPYLPVPSLSSILLPPSGDDRDIFATALCVMLPVTAVSAWLYYVGGMSTSLTTVAIIALPAAAGGLLGAFLLGKIPRALLRKIFAVLVVVSGFRMLF